MFWNTKKSNLKKEGNTVRTIVNPLFLWGVFVLSVLQKIIESPLFNDWLQFVQKELTSRQSLDGAISNAQNTIAQYETERVQAQQNVIIRENDLMAYDTHHAMDPMLRTLIITAPVTIPLFMYCMAKGIQYAYNSPRQNDVDDLNALNGDDSNNNNGNHDNDNGSHDNNNGSHDNNNGNHDNDNGSHDNNNGNHDNNSNNNGYGYEYKR